MVIRKPTLKNSEIRRKKNIYNALLLAHPTQLQSIKNILRSLFCSGFRRKKIKSSLENLKKKSVCTWVDPGEKKNFAFQGPSHWLSTSMANFCNLRNLFQGGGGAFSGKSNCLFQEFFHPQKNSHSNLNRASSMLDAKATRLDMAHSTSRKRSLGRFLSEGLG